MSYPTHLMQDQAGDYRMTLTPSASFDRAHMLRRIFVVHLLTWLAHPEQ